MRLTSPSMIIRALARSFRWKWPALAAFAVAMLAGCMGLDQQQRRWIFQAAPATSGQAAQVEGMDDVWIEHLSATSGHNVKLHALWYPSEDPKAPVLLYLHGARRSVDGSAFRIRHMQSLGFSVLAVDYRGFGLIWM